MTPTRANSPEAFESAAGIRAAIAERELSIHGQQVDDAQATDEFLRGKFTNQNLYQWMIGQVSGIYFQSYRLANELAKRAERCLQHELGLAYGETSYIQFGYWDSLKKGLLSGELLTHDLRRLDAAYFDRNVCEYEMTKHVSLLSLAPEQLIALKVTGSCEVTTRDAPNPASGPGTASGDRVGGGMPAR